MFVAVLPESAVEGSTWNDELVAILSELDVSIVVALGALLADTPHTRPTPVTGTSYDAESASAMRVAGPVDIPAFHGAMREILRRHEALRTAFAVRDLDDGEREVIALLTVPELDEFADAGQRDEADGLLESRHPFAGGEV